MKINWEKGVLSDLAEIDMGQSPPGESCSNNIVGLPLLNGPTEFTNNFPIPVQYTNDPKKRSRVGDLLFCVRGSTTGKMNWSNQEYAIGRGIAAIRHKKSPRLNRFVKAVIEYNLEELLSGATGSTFPNISRNELNNVKIVIPSIPEQEFISEALSSLDDKIDLLHRQNKTLEQIAETLFRQWFVEEAEANWEEVRLDEIATIQNGYAFKSGEYVEIGIDTLEVFKMGHISPDGGLKSSPKKDFVPRNSSLNRWILKKRDIVLAMTDMKDNVVILGVPALIDKDDHYVLNQRVARIVLKPGAKVTNQLLLYYYMSDPDFISTLQSKASSGVQVNLSTESIRESSIKIAPIKKQERAIPILNYIAEKQEKGRLQIGLLENMRDSILPKLMNGSVRVINN